MAAHSRHWSCLQTATSWCKVGQQQTKHMTCQCMLACWWLVCLHVAIRVFQQACWLVVLLVIRPAHPRYRQATRLSVYLYLCHMPPAELGTPLHHYDTTRAVFGAYLHVARCSHRWQRLDWQAALYAVSPRLIRLDEGVVTEFGQQNNRHMSRFCPSGCPLTAVVGGCGLWPMGIRGQGGVHGQTSQMFMSARLQAFVPGYSHSSCYTRAACCHILALECTS